MAQQTIVILGCGHLGRLLAEALDRRGETVHVVDSDPERLAHLPARVRAAATQTDPLHAIVEQAALLKGADAVAVVTDSDELNLALGIVCHRTRGVPHVLARVHDPGRVSRFVPTGVRAVSVTELEAAEFLRRLDAAERDPPSGGRGRVGDGTR